MEKYWNYRVLHHNDGGQDWYAVHEVYYEGDVPISCSQDPDIVMSTESDGVKDVLNMMLVATEKEILEYNSFGSNMAYKE